jgi:hypothetical protein
LEAVASLAGLHPLLSARSAEGAPPASTGTADTVRRAAVATLFALHTTIFGIYLRPGQGRRKSIATPKPDPQLPGSPGPASTRELARLLPQIVNDQANPDRR